MVPCGSENGFTHAEEFLMQYRLKNVARIMSVLVVASVLSAPLCRAMDAQYIALVSMLAKLVGSGASTYLQAQQFANTQSAPDYFIGSVNRDTCSHTCQENVDFFEDSTKGLQSFGAIILVASMLDAIIPILGIGFMRYMDSYHSTKEWPLQKIYLSAGFISLMLYIFHATPHVWLKNKYGSLAKHLDALPNEVHDALDAIRSENNNAFIALSVTQIVTAFWFLAGINTCRESYSSL